MSHSSKLVSARRDELDTTQLSLFAPRRTGEQRETTDIETRTEKKQHSEAAQAPAEVHRTAVRAKKSPGYSAADIQVLEGIAAIRHRPGMYIGSTSTSGLLHLIWEALDNAVDEAVAGFGKHIWISIDAEGWVTVRDEARGMPFDPMLYQGDYLPAATVILTVPHSGGKFAEGAYKTAGGLHGVGATVINALSEKLELTIWKDGQRFTQVFSRGVAMPHQITACDPKVHGTQLHWLYDRSIFDPDAFYSLESIQSRLKAAAYLNRGVSLNLDAWDDSTDEQMSRIFYSRDGLPDYVRDLAISTGAP